MHASASAKRSAPAAENRRDAPIMNAAKQMNSASAVAVSIQSIEIGCDDAIPLATSRSVRPSSGIVSGDNARTIASGIGTI